MTTTTGKEIRTILNIISSPAGGASYSNRLGNAILERIMTRYPGSTVRTGDLVGRKYPHLEEAFLSARFASETDYTEEQKAAMRHSDEAIAELMDADIIVISVPMYNFNIPSNLKAWLDHIIRAGKTFQYGSEGPQGLVKGKKAYIAFASGGVYSEGLMQPYDFATPYLKMVLGFIGITDINIVRVEGTAIPGLKEEALQKAIDTITID